MGLDTITVLASAAAGAIIAALAGWARDRTRWKRSYEARWDADRRRTYAGFLAGCVIYSDAITDLATALASKDTADIERRRDLLYHAHRELMAPLFEQRLIGSEGVVAAADALKDNLDAYREAAKAGRSDLVNDPAASWCLGSGHILNLDSAPVQHSPVASHGQRIYGA
jgi:hypothetical protein